jgi:hypothetical protein
MRNELKRYGEELRLSKICQESTEIESTKVCDLKEARHVEMFWLRNGESRAREQLHNAEQI